ncbi:iron ABC transporter permease [Brevibacillus centrosporus]|uniref:FecCD family ABC transporter permease n=1 Tax=Brevibacillus centrosporus TaxID=54910 RepID=UPI002E241F6E|nr:iron ABC transporter permease [Brevibacillus centrosporus]
MVRNSPLILLLCSPILLIFGIFLSISYGAADITFQQVWHAVFSYDPENVSDNIIMTSRLPRALGSLLIGCLLAVSGAMMQGVTRNYLASPSILGVSDGSVLFVTIALVFFSNSSMELMIFSFLGSLVATLFVFGISRIIPNGFQPVRLAIIGVVTGTLFSSVATGISIYFKMAQSVSFWYNTRLDKMDISLLKLSLPFGLAGLILAILLSRSITILSLGDDTATNLGMKTPVVKGLSMIAVALMTGAAVAVAGSIAFIGLVIPHITRFLVGTDYRWIVPCSGCLGAIFLCFADVLSRFVNAPYETPITIVISFVCIPFFIYLVYKKGGSQGV